MRFASAAIHQLSPDGARGSLAMKTLIRFVLVVAILCAIGAVAYRPVRAYWKERNRTDWQTEKVTRGRIVSIIESTGTVKPVVLVSVGSFVSGPIAEVYATFNQAVKKGDVLARIDPRIYNASVARDEALLSTQKAEVERAQAMLDQAIRDEQRSIALQKENENFISPKEMDAVHFNRLSLAAQVRLAEATVKQGTAALSNSKANQDYTEIRSPVDGIIIESKVNPGQTLAAQFQTPELFTIAPEMDKKMHVFAAVDEADIGLIQTAQVTGATVKFRVDAYPDELFEGQIEQIRKNSTSTQNVVTYPVVVAAPNPDLKLLPGMTATLYFRVGEKTDVLRIPNSTFLFFPKPEQVRPEDRELLMATSGNKRSELLKSREAEFDDEVAGGRSNRRHVWVVDGDLLKGVSIETGMIGSSYTEVIEGEIAEGDELVTGVKTAVGD
jgi:HlyD family secretion protein